MIHNAEYIFKLAVRTADLGSGHRTLFLFCVVFLFFHSTILRQEKDIQDAYDQEMEQADRKYSVRRGLSFRLDFSAKSIFLLLAPTRPL